MAKNLINTLDNDAHEALPLNLGQTRFCLFPFSKPNIVQRDGDFYVGLCCSSSLKKFPITLLLEDGALADVWNNKVYEDIRRSLLTGENMPPACVYCERAVGIDPVDMQFHVALWHSRKTGDERSLAYLRRNASRYNQYASAMMEIGEKPLEIPDFDIVEMKGVWANESNRTLISKWRPINYASVTVEGEQIRICRSAKEPYYPALVSIVETMPGKEYELTSKLSPHGKISMSISVHATNSHTSAKIMEFSTNDECESGNHLFVAQSPLSAIKVTVSSNKPNCFGLMGPTTFRALS